MVIPLGIALAISVYGYTRGSLSLSGALAACFVGWVTASAGFRFILVVLVFFMSSSQITKIGSSVKRSFDPDYIPSGSRNWVQVVANGGVGTVLCLIHHILFGIEDTYVDIETRPLSTFIVFAFLSFYASAAGDTWSSEIGVLCSSEPFSLSQWQRVPRGTNGAVSFGGTIAACVAGLFLGATMWLFTLAAINSPNEVDISTPQWVFVPIGLFAGLIGTLIDSLLGGSLQFSGFDETTGKIVEFPGESVRRISGIPLLDNHLVNLLTNSITSLLIATLSCLALRCWCIQSESRAL